MRAPRTVAKAQALFGLNRTSDAGHRNMTLSRVFRRGLLVAAIACPVIVIVLVARLGVNVPFTDEWDWMPTVDHAFHGTLTFAELWQQTNEHRMLVGKLAVIALSTLGGWNGVREEYVSIVLCALTQFVLWLLARRTLPGAALPLAIFAMSVSLWNVGQAENFAAGFQLTWFLFQLMMVVAVWRR